MPLRRWLCPFAVAAVFSIALGAQTPSARPTAAIEPDALKEWLTYIASDELQGRQVYTEGLGLAAAYIADHLREWGVKPVGDNGSYFQTVKVTGVKTTSEATVTVRVNGETRTFKDGEGITFSRNMGGKQTIAGEQVLFAGYGLQIPNATIDDYANIDPRGKIVIWVGSAGPKAAASESRRLLSSTARSRLALEKGARAVIGPRVTGAFGRGGRGGLATPAPSASGGRGAGADVDFTTTERYDRPIPPALSATDEFFEFLFSGSELKYAQLKELADAQAPLAPFALKGVTLTIDVNPEYTTVNTRLTRNVVGVVEGTDPKLKNTYVVFSAHYDHTGYQQALPQAGISSGVSGGSAGGCEGQTRPTPRPGDVINNGADDDGSGTVALMGLAKAFALGPKPRRSLLFVWHTAEEGGLLGSRYNADYPVVPNEHIIAALNIDMVGRNRCDDPAQANTVYLVGSDRISTDLHNISEDANASLAKPMTLDYEMNDPADPQSIYTRSDHYSYAAKGVPIAFYFTGLHADYHRPTDTVDKIIFDKVRRIAQLAYETGRRIASSEQAPVKDNVGPRAGKGFKGTLPVR